MQRAQTDAAGPPRIAVAGATGNAGKEIVRALADRGALVRALVRDPARLGPLAARCAEVVTLEVTREEDVRGALDGVECFVTALGKTWQRDSAPRRAVDVDANVRLFQEARRAGVRRIGMTSVAWADRQSPVAMLRMKGEAEDALRETGVAHVIIRPSGFFSDMWEVLQMCRRGTFWSFGDAYLNPISPVDLGDFIAEHVLDASRVGPFEVGGPDAYDIPALAALCGRVLEREVRVRRVPMWLARAGVAMIRPFSRNLWEMSDFFIGSSALTHAAGMSALLPKYGTHHLEDYLRERLASVGE